MIHPVDKKGEIRNINHWMLTDEHQREMYNGATFTIAMPLCQS